MKISKKCQYLDSKRLRSLTETRARSEIGDNNIQSELILFCQVKAGHILM